EPGGEVVDHLPGLAGRDLDPIAELEHRATQIAIAGRDGLADRVHAQRLDLSQAPLAVGIEHPHALDLVAPPLESGWEPLERDPHVHDPAADRKAAGIADGVDPLVAGRDQ